jgi:ABC-type multidrug transport system fused ATPase/permease subunit
MWHVIQFWFKCCRPFFAIKWHNALVDKLLALPMSFFDTQPTGRLVNRFTRDVEACDITLQGTISSFTTCMTSVAFSVLVVVAVTRGAIVLALVPLFLFYRCALLCSWRRPPCMQYWSISSQQAYFLLTVHFCCVGQRVAAHFDPGCTAGLCSATTLQQAASSSALTALRCPQSSAALARRSQGWSQCARLRGSRTLPHATKN